MRSYYGARVLRQKNAKTSGEQFVKSYVKFVAGGLSHAGKMAARPPGESASAA